MDNCRILRSPFGFSRVLPGVSSDEGVMMVPSECLTANPNLMRAFVPNKTSQSRSSPCHNGLSESSTKHDISWLACVAATSMFNLTAPITPNSVPVAPIGCFSNGISFDRQVSTGHLCFCLALPSNCHLTIITCAP